METKDAVILGAFWLCALLNLIVHLLQFRTDEPDIALIFNIITIVLTALSSIGALVAGKIPTILLWYTIIPIFVAAIFMIVNIVNKDQTKPWNIVSWISVALNLLTTLLSAFFLYKAATAK
jgi:amino acid permease